MLQREIRQAGSHQLGARGVRIWKDTYVFSCPDQDQQEFCGELYVPCKIPSKNKSKILSQNSFDLTQ